MKKLPIGLIFCAVVSQSAFSQELSSTQALKLISVFRANPFSDEGHKALGAIIQFATDSKNIEINIDTDKLSFANEGLEDSVSGILLGAFIVGNTEKQILLSKKGDQYAAGVEFAYYVYDKIKTANPKIVSTFFEEYETSKIKRIPSRKDNPTSNEKARAFYNKAIDMYDQKNYLEAKKNYEAAIQEDPKFTDAMDNLGLTLKRMGKIDEAIAWFEKSLALLPENITALIHLGQLYPSQKKIDAALIAFARVIAIDPNDPEGYYGLASLLQNLGDFETSVANFDRAIELYLASESDLVYDSYFLQGYNRLKLSQFELALDFFTKAQVAYGDNQALKKLIEEAKKNLK